jgi:hypothetical protein
MSTLTHTCGAVVLRDCSERELNRIVGIKANLVHEAVQPLRVENAFHFAEDCLDWIELGAVSDVEDWRDVEGLVVRLHVSTLVHRQIVHE